MNAAMQTQAKTATKTSVDSAHPCLLQRKCACGGSSDITGECESCSGKRLRGFQTKLTISEPGDQYEEEADRVASEVMRMAEPSASVVPRAISGSIQRKPTSNNGAGTEDPAVNNVLSSTGQPLDQSTKTFFEPRFGHDFGSVLVHADDQAAQSARAVHARAYTVGNHIVFGRNQFSPDTTDGRRLLAHELTHVIQQGAAENTRPPQDESETGDSTRGNSVAEIGRDSSRTVAPRLSAGLMLQKADCPCCAESISISNITRIDDATHMGHSFNTNMGLSYPQSGPTGSCTLEWWEKTNVPAVAGHPPNTWTDMYQLMGGASFGTWNNRHEECGTSTVVVDTDPPKLAKLPGRTVTRTLEFRIVINSMPPSSEGGCTAASQQVTAKQVLTMVNGAPDWSASSFTTP